MIAPCCEQTRTRIMNQFTRKDFSPGDLVMEQSKRSPWNLVHSQIYQKFKPVIVLLDDG